MVYKGSDSDVRWSPLQEKDNHLHVDKANRLEAKVVIGDFSLVTGTSLDAGQCTAFFDVVCQENSTRTAFTNRRDSNELIFLNDKLYKFKLTDSTNCFKATRGPGASKWFPPEMSGDVDQGQHTPCDYYMVGGKLSPIVGGDESKAATQTDGWVMESHIGKASISCFPYQV